MSSVGEEVVVGEAVVEVLLTAGPVLKSVLRNLSLTEIVPRRMWAEAGAAVTDEWSSRRFKLLIVLLEPLWLAPGVFKETRKEEDDEVGVGKHLSKILPILRQAERSLSHCLDLLACIICVADTLYPSAASQ